MWFNCLGMHGCFWAVCCCNSGFSQPIYPNFIFIIFFTILHLSSISFLKRTLIGSVLVAMLVEIAGLVLFNVPFTLNLSIVP